MALSWPEVVLAGINMMQLVALAWIATRQQQVKRDLNGTQDEVVRELAIVRARLDATGRPYRPEGDHGLDRDPPRA